MANRLALLVALVSILVALAVAWFAETQYQQLVATTELVVPTVEIPPYTLVAPGMFKMRAFPAPMAREAVHRALDDTRGKLTTTTLQPGQLIYQTQLVAPRQFRYSDDERLEIVSFPIKPEQAVGGQIKVGQHINIYRVVMQTQPSQQVATSPDPRVWLSAVGAGIELLIPDAAVVDVRSTQGAPVVAPPKVKTQTQEVTTYESASTSDANQTRPLTILTVAVPPDIAKDIVRLSGEAQITSRYLLWVSLAPIVKSGAGK
jgi:hypothetical protein